MFDDLACTRRYSHYIDKDVGIMSAMHAIDI